MSTVKELNKWANAHTTIFTDIVRIALGAFLIFKGYQFVTQKNYLHEIFSHFKNFGSEMLIIHIVAFAHMVGGILIVFGLFTRRSALIQIPILSYAFLLNFIETFNWSNTLQSGICLLLCLFFVYFGGGKHSADYNFKMEQ